MSEVDKPFEIPEHWDWTTFDEIGEWTGGGTPSKRKTSYWQGDIPWVSPKDMKRLEIDDTEDHVTETAVAESATKRVPSDSILFVTRSGILAHTLPTALVTVPVTINQDLKALVLTEDIEPQFLLYYTRAVGRSILSQCSKHGTTVASLESGRLYRFPVPLPPLPEQRRIVAKIEELFSNLDAGMGELSVAEQQLERYRLSVLQAAVEGRLTADWRRTHDPEPADQLLERILEERRKGWEKRYRSVRYEVKDKEPPRGWKKRYDEPKSFDKEQDLPKLPESWTWTNLEQLKVFSRYGPRFSSDDYEENGHFVVRTTDISEHGKVDTQSAPRIPLNETDTVKYQLRRGDLVITRTGSIGTLAVFNDDVECIAGAYLIQFRPVRTKTLPWYVFNVFKSPSAQRYLKEGSSGVGRPNLNAPTIESYPIPLPPLAEQKQIVAEVERLLSVADDASATTKQEQTRAERLRQSILKQAFSGNLVPHEAQHSTPEASPKPAVREGGQIEMGI